MENIIDETYFWGELSIGGLLVQNSSIQSKSSDKKMQELYQYIAKYQRNYLVAMFGKTIADNMPVELTALLYDDVLKTSPIANYVYCMFQKSYAIASTPSGDKVLTNNNARSVSSAFKIMPVWNEMVAENQRLQTELYELETIGTLNYMTDIYPYIDFDHNIFYSVNEFGI